MAEEQLLYAPAIEFHGARVPIVDLADYIRRRAYLGGLLSLDSPYTTFWNGDAQVVAFPMLPATYLEQGAFLLENFHSECLGGKEDDANEFLHCFHPETSGRENLPPPARAMYANLYLSLGGDSWVSWQVYKVLREDPRVKPGTQN